MPSHPRLLVLGRAIAFARDAALVKWIEHEVSDQQLTVEVVGSMREVATALVDREPPRPQILIADFDALTPAEVLELSGIREVWFGVLIAIGTVPEELRSSLNIERVLDRSLAADGLRKAVAAVGLHRATTRMTTFR